MKRETKLKKATFATALFVACVVCILFIANTVQEPMIIKQLEEKTVPFQWAVGRGAPADETTFVEFFLLDRSCDPYEALQNNVTYEGMGNVSGYIDADNTNSSSIGSEEYFYPVCVIAYNRTHCYDEDQWVLDRASCRLTFAVDDPLWMVGDESIDDVEGYKVEMSNVSSAKHFYVAFWWDDGDNGYAFKDNAPGVDWNVTISATF